MKNIGVQGILIVVISVGILHWFDMQHHGELTIERAMEPVRHLSDARHSIVNDDFNRAVYELDEAIMEMRIIEQYADSSSVAHIEQAIEDLEIVEMEIKSDSLVLLDLNKAFFNALNSIAFACMTISENNLDQGEKYKAMRFMNATFAEMIASLKFVNSQEVKEKEEKVIEHVREILDKMKESDFTYKFNYDTINHELEELIEL
jgi:hypothetical protein